MARYPGTLRRALIAAACLAASSAHANVITNTYALLGSSPLPRDLDGLDTTLSVTIPDFGTIQSFIVHLTFAKCGSPATGGGPALTLGVGGYECTAPLLDSFPNEIHVELSGPGFPSTGLIFGDDGIPPSTFPAPNIASIGGGRYVLELSNGAGVIIGGGAGPSSGSFIAEGALPDSVEVNGTWLLTVGDTSQLAPLGLESASIEITFDQITGTVPVPGTLALFGLGLAGLGALKRRR